LALFTGASELELPTRPQAGDDDRLRPFDAPESAAPPSYTEFSPKRVQRTIARDGAAGEVVQTILSEEGGFGGAGPGRVDAIDLELEHSSMRRYRIRELDPLSAGAEVLQRMRLRRGEWAVTVETRVSLSATRDAFELSATLDAFDGDTLVRSRNWDASIPRDGV